jgi:hypothetical protein
VTLRRANDDQQQEWLTKPESSLRQIIERGFERLLPFYNEWNEPNLIRDYEHILDKVFRKQGNEESIPFSTRSAKVSASE